MAKKGMDHAATAEPGDTSLAGAAAVAETATAGGAEGTAGENSAAVAQDGVAVHAADAVEPDASGSARAIAEADAVSADGPDGNAGGDGEASPDIPEVAEPDAGAPRLFLTLGTTAPDPDIGFSEISLTDLAELHGRDAATVTVAVEMLAEPDLVKRQVTTVFLLGGHGERPDVLLGQCELQTAVQFGAGNGLFLSARSLVLKRAVDHAE